jgi:hypothetical protein
MKQLSPAEQTEWLEQHIRSRALAALSKPELVRSWLANTPRDQTALKRELMCVLQSSWEGRHAAIRWLIEFVGNCDYRGSKYLAPTPHTRGREHSFRITGLPGGRPIVFSEELADIYSALTKATAHPTRDSKHSPISSDRLKKAAQQVIDHLQKTVYAEVGKSL